ncbi:hypothetical protein TIFTF001_033027 [Ficus carica]|uniref:R13L1/DRL21-like LRR repeat region domain-containing protein n=1 Tax=Ficus carica TaxID=3494 RepID=A0AA88J359_FICCA|nr:hypothetical protein TIFTF001_033027 [Ficus carica]
MPPEMCNLTELQTLSYFVLGKNSGSSIKELGALHYLSGALEISELQNVDVVRDVWDSKLCEKEHLRELVFCWSADHDSRRDKEVLDALRPHTNVKEIVIDSYGGETFSNWVGHCSYTNMVIVNIGSCYNCCLFPPLGQLPSLQNLVIYECHGVERIGAEFYSDGSSNTKPFRTLKSLRFVDMSKLQEWSFPGGHEDGGCFPLLEHLHIIRCPKLNMCLPDYFPSLKTLEIRCNEQIVVLQGVQRIETSFPSLELLNIEDCPRLEIFLLSNFPSSLKELHLSGYDSYHRGTIVPPCLAIQGCENVITFPEALLPTTLTLLRIEGLGNLKALNEEGFRHLTSLKRLRIDGCEKLQFFRGEVLPTSLAHLHLRKLAKLKALNWEGFQHLTSLVELIIEGCDELQFFHGEVQSTSLASLHLRKLAKLVDLGKGLQGLISLTELQIFDCERLRHLPENELPTSLTSLYMLSLPSLEDPGKGFFQHLISLKELEIKWCGKFKYGSVEENGKGIKHLSSLTKLVIWYCEKLQSLLEDGLPTSLTFLSIAGFPKLREMNRMDFQHLNLLQAMEIWWCENLQCLPAEGLPSSLSFLDIYGCPLLEPRCQKGTGSDWHKISHISHIEISRIIIA